MYEGYSSKQIKAITESPQGKQELLPTRRALLPHLADLSYLRLQSRPRFGSFRKSDSNHFTYLQTSTERRSLPRSSGSSRKSSSRSPTVRALSR
jgi:hypothetical protein